MLVGTIKVALCLLAVCGSVKSIGRESVSQGNEVCFFGSSHTLSCVMYLE